MTDKEKDKWLSACSYKISEILRCGEFESDHMTNFQDFNMRLAEAIKGMSK